MEYFKNVISKQIERFKSVREGGELYFIFFRLSQAYAAGVTLQYLFAIRPLSADLTFLSPGTFGSSMYFEVALRGTLTILLCEIGLRCLDKDKIFGFYVGVLLSLKFLFSFGFLLGLFGLYALLNPSAQRKFLADATPWLREILTLCKINYIAENKNPTEEAKG